VPPHRPRASTDALTQEGIDLMSDCMYPLEPPDEGSFRTGPRHHMSESDEVRHQSLASSGSSGISPTADPTLESDNFSDSADSSSDPIADSPGYPLDCALPDSPNGPVEQNPVSASSAPLASDAHPDPAASHASSAGCPRGVCPARAARPDLMKRGDSDACLTCASCPVLNAHLTPGARPEPDGRDGPGGSSTSNATSESRAGTRSCPPASQVASPSLAATPAVSPSTPPVPPSPGDVSRRSLPRSLYLLCRAAIRGSNARRGSSRTRASHRRLTASPDLRVPSPSVSRKRARPLPPLTPPAGLEVTVRRDPDEGLVVGVVVDATRLPRVNAAGPSVQRVWLTRMQARLLIRALLSYAELVDRTGSPGGKDAASRGRTPVGVNVPATAGVYELHDCGAVYPRIEVYASSSADLSTTTPAGKASGSPDTQIGFMIHAPQGWIRVRLCPDQARALAYAIAAARSGWSLPEPTWPLCLQPLDSYGGRTARCRPFPGSGQMSTGGPRTKSPRDEADRS